MISLERVSHDWGGIFSLKDISLSVKDGEYFVILGPTGSGKTLLLEVIAGIYHPREGRVVLQGEDVTQLAPERRNIGFLYQDYNLFPHYDVMKNISYGLAVRGVEKEECLKRSRELVASLSIGHLVSRDVTTLSGGEQQKVALARALAPRPRILLLDEPFSALDENTKAVLVREMKEVHRRERVTVVHVTHSQEEAMIMADRIGVMMDGRIVQVGTPEEIFYRPQSTELASFVKIENVWSGVVARLEEDAATVDLGAVMLHVPPDTLAVGETVRVMLRPEDVVVGSSSPGSARNALSGVVTDIEPRGFYSLVRIDCGVLVTATVTKRSLELLSLTVGASASAIFKMTALHVIRQ